VYSLDDTIAAISTPVGQGGIGIVRLSGPQALQVVSSLFHSKSRAWARGPEPFRMYYGRVVRPDSGDAVDQVLVSYMRGPHSYTRQDVVEINGHGGIVALSEILSLCLSQGARMARAGEFTLRAFLNGRLDLTQSEAVLDVIQARTSASLGQAIGQLEGRLSTRVRHLRRSLLEMLAYIEATNDFDEDIPEQDLRPPLEAAHRELKELEDEAGRGMVLRSGVRVAIVGRPNVGKSSLLNALLRADRAIVTAVPGTTRDTLEEIADIGGVPFVLVDTAGISETDDVVERLGVERSRQALLGSDLGLLVVDGSEGVTDEDRAAAALCDPERTLIAVNKSDLPHVADCTDLMEKAMRLPVSAATGAGLPDLEQAMLRMVYGGTVAGTQLPLVTSARHRDLLTLARRSVRDALIAMEGKLPEDVQAIDIADAIARLGDITGETASEELLDTIFSRFCIGK